MGLAAGTLRRAQAPAAEGAASACWAPLVEGVESIAGVDGSLRVAVYPNRAGAQCVAWVKGDVAGCYDVPTRVHSECLFGDAFGSSRCQCGPQLQSFLQGVLGDAAQPCAVLLYMRGHEGKGIGLANKLRAYNLQDGPEKLCEAEANRRLGFMPDMRRYGSARAALRHLDVRSVALYTDSSRKAAALGRLVSSVVRWRPTAMQWGGCTKDS